MKQFVFKVRNLFSNLFLFYPFDVINKIAVKLKLVLIIITVVSVQLLTLLWKYSCPWKQKKRKTFHFHCLLSIIYWKIKIKSEKREMCLRILLKKGSEKKCKADSQNSCTSRLAIKTFFRESWNVFFFRLSGDRLQ